MPDTLRMVQASEIRVLELVVDVTSRLEGNIDDWPSNIQDGVYTALENASRELKCPLQLVASRCDYDVDTGWFIHCWASEIVAGIDSAEMAKRAIDLALTKGSIH